MNPGFVETFQETVQRHWETLPQFLGFIAGNVFFFSCVALAGALVGVLIYKVFSLLHKRGWI